jgi:mannan endo-1,4-beta-mannosidase
LWDSTYNESSWIKSSIGGPIQLIPMLKAKIAAHYPGTKLAFTEYNYGAGGDISGGIAHADVLGIFGQQGVFAANMWGLSSVTYIDGAFQMYRDPAGNGTKIGDTSVSTTNSDIVDASAYGFANSANANEVDAVVLNKTASPKTTTIQITNPVSVNYVEIYQLTSASAVPQPAGTFAVQNNQYQYTMPAYSVSTLVFTAGSPSPMPPQPSAAPTPVAALSTASSAARQTSPGPAPNPKRPWVAQLIGDSSETAALSRFRRLQGKLSSALGSYEPTILRTAIKDGTTWVRIRVEFDTREAAQALCSKLEAAREHCWVLRN